MKFFLHTVLLFVIFISAVFTVITRHDTRLLFLDVQHAEKELSALQVERNQLWLERSAWSSLLRVDQFARSQLKMTDESKVVLFRDIEYETSQH